MSARPSDHPVVKSGRVGVLLVNLGTPDGTDYWSVRRYLREFLGDRRVIEMNPVLWWLLLNAVILTFRPRRSGRAYKSIWNSERDESPLRTIVRAQAAAVADGLAGDSPHVSVSWAMRYGNPSIGSRLRELADGGCDRILLFPLYPQYAASTTATACDAAFRALAEMRWQPSLRVVPPYFEDPGYIAAVAGSVREGIAALDFEPDLVLASFHGLPRDYLLRGDPYHCQCVKTGRLVREALGWEEDRLMVTFQSRFGPAEWLRPYTDETLRTLPARGAGRVAVIAPGFSADCLETLEEIAIGGKEIFQAAGGERFAYLPCLNDSPGSVGMLVSIARRELMGWI